MRVFYKCLLAALVLLPTVAPAAPAAPRSVPYGFLGVHWTGDLNRVDPDAQDAQWDLMAASGVESVRTDFAWIDAQPVRGAKFDFGRFDVLVRRATERNIALLPVVNEAPAWARAYRRRIKSPPKRPRRFAAYAAALVDRYGPVGSFWDENPELPKRPLRDWQIWNEPHLKLYWNAPARSRWGHPGGYNRLLAVTYRAIKARDRGARVVLAGITQRAWEELEEMYAAGGLKGNFDVAALQIFPLTVRRSVLAAWLFHQTMARHGDGKKPVYLTELSWPASKGRTAKVRYLTHESKRSMANKLAVAYAALARRRRALGLERVYWYTWATPYGRGGSVFNYSGLQAFAGGNWTAQPALASFQRIARKLEGCEKDKQGVCR